MEGQLKYWLNYSINNNESQSLFLFVTTDSILTLYICVSVSSPFSARVSDKCYTPSTSLKNPLVYNNRTLPFENLQIIAEAWILEITTPYTGEKTEWSSALVTQSLHHDISYLQEPGFESHQ